MEQYRRDRDPREKLFEFGRCVVHFAVDDAEVRMCTELRGQGFVVSAVQQRLERWRGQSAESGRLEDGLSVEGSSHAARPDEHPRKLRADRRGRSTRRRARKKRKQVFPRYHQLDVVRKTLARRRGQGRGRAVSHPALGRQRQIQFHRVAGAPTHRR